MIVQNIGTRALSMYIDKKELIEMGLCPDEIGQQEANQLLKKALDDESIGQWKTAEMEVYPGKDSILLFVRRKSTKPYYFIFPNFELLVSACQLCKSLPSTLSCVDGRYLLTIYPLEGDNPPTILSEFGSQAEISQGLAFHYDEQGEYIFTEKAISEIQKLFK